MENEKNNILREAAVERLSACLYLKMERMDPSGRGAWACLKDSDKEFYRASIREILREKTLLKRAIDDSSDSPTITA
jgi:hypothetical protein